MSASGKNMNCEDYKEAVAADPSATFEGAEHAVTCDACAAFKAEMQTLDAHVAKALAIDTPAPKIPDLPPIEDDNVVNLTFKGKGRAPAWIALAASFALAAIIGIQLVCSGPALSLADEILAHIDHEPGALRVTDVSVSDDTLGNVVDSSVGTLDRNVGLITYAKSCPINGKSVPHLVIQGEKGPVTLLLMPEEKVDGPSTIMGEGVNGVILPVGSGSIAIIGERDEDIGEIEQRVVDSVEWSI